MRSAAPVYEASGNILMFGKKKAPRVRGPYPQ